MTTPCEHRAVTADVALTRFHCDDCGRNLPVELTARDLAAVELALTGRRTS